MKEMDLTVPVDQSAVLHIPAECFCLDWSRKAPDIHRAVFACDLGLAFIWWYQTGVSGDRASLWPWKHCNGTENMITFILHGTSSQSFTSIKFWGYNMKYVWVFLGWPDPYMNTNSVSFYFDVLCCIYSLAFPQESSQLRGNLQLQLSSQLKQPIQPWPLSKVTMDVYANTICIVWALSCFGESWDATLEYKSKWNPRSTFCLWARAESGLTTWKCILSSEHKLEELREARETLRLKVSECFFTVWGWLAQILQGKEQSSCRTGWRVDGDGEWINISTSVARNAGKSEQD